VTDTATTTNRAGSDATSVPADGATAIASATPGITASASPVTATTDVQPVAGEQSAADAETLGQAQPAGTESAEPAMSGVEASGAITSTETQLPAEPNAAAPASAAAPAGAASPAGTAPPAAGAAAASPAADPPGAAVASTGAQPAVPATPEGPAGALQPQTGVINQSSSGQGARMAAAATLGSAATATAQATDHAAKLAGQGRTMGPQDGPPRGGEAAQRVGAGPSANNSPDSGSQANVASSSPDSTQAPAAASPSVAARVATGLDSATNATGAGAVAFGSGGSVAQSTEAPEAPAGHLGAQMQQQIESLHASVELANRAGAAQARISLQPAELGAVRIHLTQTSAGLIARVSADSAAGAQALAGGQGDLRNLLSSLGVSLLSLDLGGFAHQGPGSQRAAAEAGIRSEQADAGSDEIETVADAQAPGVNIDSVLAQRALDVLA
jgi:flagellar hook-length control protein FliK